MGRKQSNITSLADVRAALAEPEPVASVRTIIDPPAAQGRNGVGPGDWTANALGLPDDCPVIPLGIQGSTGWFLDPIGQVQQLAPPYSKGHLLGLFVGRDEYLAWGWPRWTKDGRLDTFDANRAGAQLIRACAAKGPWASIDKIRGRGCWVDGGGNLVVHAGTRIIIGKRAEPPGEIDGFVYPTRAKIAPPYTFREEAPFNPAKVLRPLLATWNWERPDIDPHLLLGWVGAAFLGAALPWRPMCFITGDKATGKSTLQALIKGLFGEWLIQAADTTAAGLYQHVGLDSIPIAVDELESEADVRKQKAVLKLARLASSGAAMLRGGDRHQGVEFNARSAFLFSSINAPPLEPQDLSRMALLRLRKLAPGGAAPSFDARTFELVGRVILRRLIEEWPRFTETFEAFAGELAAGGMDGRGQAQFGTLLTCADMIEHEGWDPERLAHACDAEGDVRPWRELLAVATLQEYEDMSENWRLCLTQLLSARVDAWRGGQRSTVGQLLEAHWKHIEQPGRDDGLDFVSANRELAHAGLKLVAVKRDSDGRPRPWLAVHNQSVLVRQLFEGSKWAGEAGASVWAPALRQGPRGTLWEIKVVRVNGVQATATILSLDGLYGEGGVMASDEL